MSYKNALYASYQSTHILHRKGEETITTLAKREKTYEGQLGHLMPKDKSAAIADLGCGSGGLVRWLAGRGHRDVIGVDISGEQVEQAARIGAERIVKADLLDFLETTHDSFDLLIARDVLEHFDRETVFRFVEAAGKRLKPGGRFVIQVPNAESPFMGRALYGDFTHELAFTPSSLRQIFNAAGFSRVTVHPCRPVATGLRSAWRALCWRVVEPLIKAFVHIESPQGGEVVTLNVIAAAELGPAV